MRCLPSALKRSVAARDIIERGIGSEPSRFVEEVEGGYDVNEIIRRRGDRPTLGASPSSVESVRVDPEPKRDVLVDAGKHGTSVS